MSTAQLSVLKLREDVFHRIRSYNSSLQHMKPSQLPAGELLLCCIGKPFYHICMDTSGSYCKPESEYIYIFVVIYMTIRYGISKLIPDFTHKTLVTFHYEEIYLTIQFLTQLSFKLDMHPSPIVNISRFDIITLLPNTARIFVLLKLFMCF